MGKVPHNLDKIRKEEELSRICPPEQRLILRQQRMREVELRKTTLGPRTKGVLYQSDNQKRRQNTQLTPNVKDFNRVIGGEKEVSANNSGTFSHDQKSGNHTKKDIEEQKKGKRKSRQKGKEKTMEVERGSPDEIISQQPSNSTPVGESVSLKTKKRQILLLMQKMKVKSLIILIRYARKKNYRGYALLSKD